MAQSIRRLATVLAFSVLDVSLGSPLHAAAGSGSLVPSADTLVPPITAVQLRKACLSIWLETRPDASNYSALSDFCAHNGNPQQLLKEMPRKHLEDVPRLASEFPAEKWAEWATKAHQNESFAAVQSIAAGLNESAIVWGIAQFMANRAKTQLNAYAFKYASSRLCNELGKRVAPESCGLLTETGAMAVLRAPTLLHAAAVRDVTKAPHVALELLIEEGESKLGNRLDNAIAMGMTLRAIAASVDGNGIEVSISSMASSMPKLKKAKLSVESSPLATALYLSALGVASVGQPFASLGEAFPQKGHAVRWAHKAFVVNLYLGRPFAAPTRNSTPIWECNPALPGVVQCPWATFTTALQGVMTGADTLRAISDRLSAATNAADRKRVLLEYSNALLAVIDSSVLRQSSLQLLAKTKEIRAGVSAISSALAANDYSQVFARVVELPGLVGGGVQLPPRAVRMMSLASSIANADSASQVAEIFETMAGTAITYSDKRDVGRGPFISFNAYLGVVGGYEVLPRRQIEVPGSWFSGAFAPLGLEVGTPVRLPIVKSLSVFLQAIDVGALTAWRLESDTQVNQEPQVKFSQVFSPGAHVMFGLGSIPLSLGVGVTATPAVRRVTISGVEETTDRGAFRLQLTLGMDIPLFP